MHKGQKEVELPSVHSFCYHDRIQNITEYSVFKPDRSETTNYDLDTLKNKFGIWIEDKRNMTTTLSIDSDDAALYDH